MVPRGRSAPLSPARELPLLPRHTRASNAIRERGIAVPPKRRAFSEPLRESRVKTGGVLGVAYERPG